MLADVEQLVRRGADAIGLTEGPVHAEVRVDDTATPAALVLIEVAARTIGGLCARTLQFGAGIALEEVVLRHALGMDLGDLARPPGAAGVMMLPIPRAGVLQRVDGRDDALAVPGSSGSRSPCPPGSAVVPLPESDRYLGFLFARADTPGRGRDGPASRRRGARYRHLLMPDGRRSCSSPPTSSATPPPASPPRPRRSAIAGTPCG